MTTTLLTNKTALQFLEVTLIATLAWVGLGSMSAYAQTNSLSASTDDYTVELAFDRATPCTQYTVEWGDGTTSEAATDAADLCIQVIDTVNVEHEYEEEGTYDISVSTGNTAFTNTGSAAGSRVSVSMILKLFRTSGSILAN